MNLHEIVKKMRILEVELIDNCGETWKELYDATLDPNAIYTIEAGAQDRNIHTSGYNMLSQEEILERLKVGTNSHKFADVFLRERVEYWQDYFPLIENATKELESSLYTAKYGATRISQGYLYSVMSRLIEKVYLSKTRLSG